jgi:hypothetical protein
VSSAWPRRHEFRPTRMIDVTCVAECGSQAIEYSRRGPRALCCHAVRQRVHCRPSRPSQPPEVAYNLTGHRVCERCSIHSRRAPMNAKKSGQEQAGREAWAEGSLAQEDERREGRYEDSGQRARDEEEPHRELPALGAAGAVDGGPSLPAVGALCPPRTSAQRRPDCLREVIRRRPSAPARVRLEVERPSQP